ncbi:MAG: helix-turn-helix transcriptional regulator [Prevotella sp.]|nr:helix-turn-helix transcriptional regulator [Prevotella sp.]
MLFSERIKKLRTINQMPQRRLAAALDIDTATYCKIERGERKAKKEQIVILSNLFNVAHEDLLTLWLADKVSDVIATDKSVASDVLSLVRNELKHAK